jgi:hypothetical protein
MKLKTAKFIIRKAGTGCKEPREKIMLVTFLVKKHVAYILAAKSFNNLEIVLPGRKQSRRQFFSRYVKE